MNGSEDYYAKLNKPFRENFSLPIRIVCELGAFKPKLKEGQVHNVIGWLIKWKWRSCLTFTMIDYYKGVSRYQRISLKCLSYTILGRWLKIVLLSEVFIRNHLS